MSASAIGYYAETPEPIDEHGPHGSGFLADVVAEWEEAARPAQEAGIRVVHPRIGLVLSPRGGLLKLQLPAFLVGLGGYLGDGKQQWSWVSHDDVVGMLHHALVTDSIYGPMNVVAPTAVNAREFARTLGKVLHRPAVVPVPLAFVRAALGQRAAREIAEASQNVVPSVALESGYSFRNPELALALGHLLGRAPS